MKKLMLAAAVALSALCIGTSVFAEEKENLLKNIAEVNKFENFLQNHENMQIHYKYRMDEEWEEQIYFSNGCFAHTTPVWSYIHEGDQTYGFDAETGYYVLAVMNGAEETLKEQYENIPYYVYEENDEIISLTTTEEEMILELLSEDVLEDDTTEVQKTVLTVDAGTNEIKKMDVYIVEEEKDTLFCTVETSFDMEYTPDEETKNAAYGEAGNTRSVTLIADPGTENEITYTALAGKESYINVILAEGYQKLYTDAECTIENVPAEKLPGELVVYTKKEN